MIRIELAAGFRRVPGGLVFPPIDLPPAGRLEAGVYRAMKEGVTLGLLLSISGVREINQARDWFSDLSVIRWEPDDVLIVTKKEARTGTGAT